MKKLGISLVLSSLMISGLSATNVSVANDGLGDFLIAPVYFAKGDICSKVTVLNTNTSKSILAKVAFREQIASNEVDLPIFLSPGDVWSGTVCQGGNGDVYLTSNDDSNHPKIRNTLANGKDLTAQSKLAGHTNIDFTTGYVEVYPIAEFNEHSTKKVEKSVLVNRWNSLINGKKPANTVSSGVDGYSLTGLVSFQTKSGKTTDSLKMVAFKGAHDRVLTGSVIAYGNDTSPSSLLGTTKKVQILKALQHSKIMFSYENGGKNQYVVFTYPFSYADEEVRKFKVTVRDMEENKDETFVVFSPAPVKAVQLMKNEVATLSVEKLIAQTQNPAKYRNGQIQIEDITNVTDVQLGVGKSASFIATSVTLGSDKTATIVEDAHPVTVK